MTIRHKLIAALLLAFPVAPVLPLLAQEPNPPSEQNQQLDPQSPPSEQPPAAVQQPGYDQPRPQPRPAAPARGNWHRFDEPEAVERDAEAPGDAGAHGAMSSATSSKNQRMSIMAAAITATTVSPAPVTSKTSRALAVKWKGAC